MVLRLHDCEVPESPIAPPKIRTGSRRDGLPACGFIFREFFRLVSLTHGYYVYRSWSTSERTLRQTAPLGPSATTCSTGRQLLWGQKTLLTLAVFSSWIFISPPTIRLRYERIGLAAEYGLFFQASDSCSRICCARPQ